MTFFMTKGGPSPKACCAAPAPSVCGDAKQGSGPRPTMEFSVGVGDPQRRCRSRTKNALTNPNVPKTVGLNSPCTLARPGTGIEMPPAADEPLGAGAILKGPVISANAETLHWPYIPTLTHARDAKSSVGSLQ